MPRCSKCASSGSLCPGYLNPLDFLIRDQTVEVINKSCALKSRKTTKDKFTPLAKEPLCAHSASTRSCPEPESLSPRRDVLLPVSNSPIDFFMVNYVSQATCNAEFTSLGSFDYLPSLYSDTPKDSMMYMIISALGLVGLSNISSTPNFWYLHVGCTQRLWDCAMLRYQIRVRLHRIVRLLQLCFWFYLRYVDICVHLEPEEWD